MIKRKCFLCSENIQQSAIVRINDKNEILYFHVECADKTITDKEAKVIDKRNRKKSRKRK